MLLSNKEVKVRGFSLGGNSLLKSKFTKILFFIILIWLVVTIYFYYQHQITLQRHVVDKTVELENASVVLKEILLSDVERKHIDFDDWRYNLGPILPASLYVPFMKICSFYSQPYQELNFNARNIELRGKLLFNEEISIEESSVLWENYDINLVDEDGVHYGSGYTTIYQGENIIYFAVSGDYYKKELTKVDIIINEKSSGSSQIIPVNLNWQPEKYNYFKRPPLNLQPQRLND